MGGGGDVEAVNDNESCGLNREHAWELELILGRSTGAKRKRPRQVFRK